jgi:hypothetical protein
MPYRECQSRKQLITNWVWLTVGYAVVFKMFKDSDGTNTTTGFDLVLA